ncbi:MAG: bacteriohemerythrin [Sideroxydans sp.]|nr:bacteriohemerythrin [Sideroxydans sp.]
MNSPLDKLELRAAMLDTIRIMQQDFLKQGISFGWCDRVLATLLKFSRSEFGFISELLHKEDGTPFIKSHGITNIAWDETTRAFYEQHAAQGMEFFNFNSLWGHAITTGEAVIANDPDNDPRRGGYPGEQGHPPLHSFLGLPIKTASGEVIGVIGLANRPGGYSQEDVEFMELFATTYGMLIEHSREAADRKRLEDELVESRRKFQSLVENISDEYCLYGHDVNGVMTYVSPSITGLLGWTPEELKVNYATLLTDNPGNQVVEQKMEGALSGVRQTPYILELRHKDGSKRWVEVSEGPVFDADGHVAGIEGIVHDVTERQKAEAQIWHQANYDRLTGLPNRSLFFDRLSREISKARRDNRYLALLYFDLDGFKPVNDQYGHEAGDEVLVCVAQRWLGCVRDADTLARIGGDEFTLIVSDMERPEMAASVAQKIVDAMSEKIVLSTRQECHVGVSVGISVYPSNAMEMDSMLSAADEAMYAIKQKKQSGFGFSLRVPISGLDKMEWIRLDDAHQVGVDEMDAEHEKLAYLGNQLNISIIEKASSEDISRQFEELIAYTVHHFESEHRLMEASAYPDRAKHEAEHAALIEAIQQLAKPPYQEKSLLILQTFKDWILQHIQKSDRELGKYLRSCKDLKK